jgi:hypothetical protein
MSNRFPRRKPQLVDGHQWLHRLAQHFLRDGCRAVVLISREIDLGIREILDSDACQGSAP